MLILITILHVIVCLFLIIVVLLQSGKAADLAGAFGGMGSQTAFGPRGSATVLSKATTIAAGLFMITSLSLSILATRNAGSTSTVLDKVKPEAKQETKQPQPSGPSVTITPEGGKPITQPLNLPPPPGQQKSAETKGSPPAPKK